MKWGNAKEVKMKCFFTSRRQSEMKMKRKVEAKPNHRGGPKTESWERIYANNPEGVV